MMNPYVYFIFAAVIGFFAGFSVHLAISRFGRSKTFGEVDDLKNEFIAVASHELRTPLTAMKGYISIVFDMVKEGKTKLDPNVKEYLEEAYNSAEALHDLINDLLEVERIESGKIKFEKVPVDTVPIINAIVEEFAPLVSAKGLLTTVSLDENLPKVSGDAQKLKEVFYNLINNAVKYTMKGEVTITASRDGKNVKFVVRDTGVGMPDEVLPRIFKKFYRGHADTTESVTGNGLGLWISKSLVKGMGGDITAKSRQWVGSTFTVYLPAA